jgi:hypothetical protein
LIGSKSEERVAAIRFDEKRSQRGKTMGACKCGYSTDPEKNCNGTHNVVKAVKADLAEKLEAAGFPHAAEFVRNDK